ncbi:hypothetical protein HaLaN_25836, partial [Haematococcus lacustris]
MEDDPLLYVWDSMHRAMQLALCAVLGRQEEGLIMDQLISTCKAQGQESKQRNELQADASCLAAAALDVMAGEYYCL